MSIRVGNSMVLRLIVCVIFACCCCPVHGAGLQDQQPPTKDTKSAQESTPKKAPTSKDKKEQKQEGDKAKSEGDKTKPESNKAKPESNKAKPEEKSKDENSVDEILAGHSYHGEAFNEGPRQKAYLMGGTGNVRFPVTCKSKRVQAFINQGVGQLHGFWDLEAERTFRHAASLDSECAMAYWGAALATVRNRKRARGFIEKAHKLREKVTKREQMYIAALFAYLMESDAEKKGEKNPSSETKKTRASEYLKALESIVLEFPEDLEAKAFVAHRIWQNAREGIPVASYLSTDALLKEIYEQEPLHPAHHYTIHLWDYRKPERAVRAAARCGPSAPSIAHMWHMPGHIYSRLKRYEDAVYQQEASARVDHAHMMRDRVMPDEIHNFAHNNEWLIRNLAYIGRVHDALDLAKNMTELPQHPKYNTLEKRGGSASYGRRRLLQLLREYELHQQAVELCQSVYLEVEGNAVEKTKTLRLLGCSSAALGNEAVTNAVLEKLNRLIEGRKNVLARTEKTIDELDKKIKAEEKKGKNGDKAGIAKWKDQLKKDRTDNKKAKTAKSNLEKAIKAIEGYRLIQQKKYAEGLAKLKKVSGEDRSWLGEIAFLAAGDDAKKQDAAIALMQKQIDRRKMEVIPLARMTYVLYQAGKKDKAKEVFEKLRDTSTSIDLDIPLFQRLAPIASEFGFQKNWLKERIVAADLGFRPTLDSLGPFRWAPSESPRWSLKDSQGITMGDVHFSGKPHIIIFYLGHGCLHCAEQLQAFGPRAEDFKKAGIDIVAISSDDANGLKQSLADYGSEMPIPLLSDANKDIFKKFRAFDDFEKQPLHGTFLVDEKGMIRWQDIGYEPFMDHNFLLLESQRLLNQSKIKNKSRSAISKRKP